MGPGLLACGEAVQHDLPGSAHDEVVADCEGNLAIHEFHLEVALCATGVGGLLEKRSIKFRVGGQAEPELAGPGLLAADQIVERLHVCVWSGAGGDGLDIGGNQLLVVVEGRDLDVVTLKDQVDGAVVPGACRTEGIRAGHVLLPVIDAVAVGVCLGGVGIGDRVLDHVVEPIAVIVHIAVSRGQDGGVLEHGGHVSRGAMEDDRVGIGLGDADILSVDFCPVRARDGNLRSGIVSHEVFLEVGHAVAVVVGGRAGGRQVTEVLDFPPVRYAVAVGIDVGICSFDVQDGDCLVDKGALAAQFNALAPEGEFLLLVEVGEEEEFRGCIAGDGVVAKTGLADEGELCLGVVVPDGDLVHDHREAGGRSLVVTHDDWAGEAAGVGLLGVRGGAEESDETGHLFLDHGGLVLLLGGEGNGVGVVGTGCGELVDCDRHVGPSVARSEGRLGEDSALDLVALGGLVGPDRIVGEGQLAVVKPESPILEELVSVRLLGLLLEERAREPRVVRQLEPEIDCKVLGILDAGEVSDGAGEVLATLDETVVLGAPAHLRSGDILGEDRLRRAVDDCAPGVLILVIRNLHIRLCDFLVVEDCVWGGAGRLGVCEVELTGLRVHDCDVM